MRVVKVAVHEVIDVVVVGYGLVAAGGAVRVLRFMSAALVTVGLMKTVLGCAGDHRQFLPRKDMHFKQVVIGVAVTAVLRGRQAPAAVELSIIEVSKMIVVANSSVTAVWAV